MTSRRLSPRRLEIIRRHLDRGCPYVGEVIVARMIQEIDALTTERDMAEADARLLAKSFLSENIVDDGSIEAWDRWRPSEPWVAV